MREAGRISRPAFARLGSTAGWLLGLALVIAPLRAVADEQTSTREPFGINLEGFSYPYPVRLICCA